MSVGSAGGAGSDTAGLRRLALRVLGGRRLRLIVDDEAPVEVPQAVGEALDEVLAILGEGKSVRVVPQNTLVTVGEAARLLGVGRLTVVKLMEDGVLPFTRPNSSRRIALRDVLVYKGHWSRRRRETLDEMTADAVDLGLYREAIDGTRGSHTCFARRCATPPRRRNKARLRRPAMR
ncbi:hypothetical protein Cs7R123_63630 [Catellatospora sp. TT07R-123]|uniref:excisionase family DNA-binding protein n=1 Tax=Catellatospora sp. TT07R-123 TaxID=2733863 RepID=UPI001B09DE83|nr:excisionase family DNA-binding protein [Catellatospora sp. TT07R-123]GHJ49021.1 hypothetical protein Cs7R123_63630 [Catellatospora sp. TT07R-123]